MRVGVIELLTEATSSWSLDLVYSRFKRAYASITPQAVSTWCRQLGHDVFYATYYGRGQPHELLPDDLDVVFVSTHSQASPLAYGMARLYRKSKTLTVIGGPHATCFPRDCLRFFDIAVHKCDKALIEDILEGRCERNSVVTSGRLLTQIPSVEEREPEIVAATFGRKERPRLLSNVALLSSVGCPYTCDFCVDWNNTYSVIPTEMLERDLRYISKKWPGLIVSYHDPNFGVRFEKVLDIIDNFAPEHRNPYVVESSLSILRDSRLRRLRDSGCVFLTAGIESWGNYSNKAGVGTSTTGREKLTKVLSHFDKLRRYFSGLQGNFIFGTDSDQGDEPVELTKEFIEKLPYVWPSINIPIPFGGTPLFDAYMSENRLLKQMPFSLYYHPYTVTVTKNYTPEEYYARVIDICESAASAKMLMRRLASTRGQKLSRSRKTALQAFYALRTIDLRDHIGPLKVIHERLRSDSGFRAFHEGRSDKLPDFYRHRHRKALGPYGELLSEAEMYPELAPWTQPVNGTAPDGKVPVPEPLLQLKDERRV